MDEDAAQRRAEKAERYEYHAEAQRRAREQEAAQAQVLIDRFVEEAKQAGLPTEELAARPWSGRGRYRTGLVGWYIRPDRSIGVGTDGSYYLLVVAPVPFGRWRTIQVKPTPPPLLIGKGARDGEGVPLEVLLNTRLSDRGPA